MTKNNEHIDDQYKIYQILWSLIIGGMGAIIGLLMFHFLFPPFYLFLTGEEPYLFVFYPPVFYLAWKSVIVVWMYVLTPVVLCTKGFHN